MHLAVSPSRERNILAHKPTFLRLASLPNRRLIDSACLDGVMRCTRMTFRRFEDLLSSDATFLPLKSLVKALCQLQLSKSAYFVIVSCTTALHPFQLWVLASLRRSHDENEAKTSSQHNWYEMLWLRACVYPSQHASCKQSASRENCVFVCWEASFNARP